MNNNDLVSIVLPIYNVEKYLDRCINSVVQQTYKNLEIILVDDGSLDSCSQLCDEWEKKDARIRVIHKINAGLGMARNTGLSYATGKYICFFDSDDYIRNDTIERALNAAMSYNSELVIFGYYDVANDGKIVASYVPVSDTVVYTGSEIQNSLLIEALSRKKLNINMSAWSAMYSLDLIKKAKWGFVSEREIISEDVYSLLGLYKELNNVTVLNECFYYYCENGGSLTRKYAPERMKRIHHFYEQTLEYSKRLGYNEGIQQAISYPYIANIIGALKLLVNSNLEESDKTRIIRELLDNPVFKKGLKGIDIDNENIKRRLLFMIMKLKLAIICKWLVRLN